MSDPRHSQRHPLGETVKWLAGAKISQSPQKGGAPEHCLPIVELGQDCRTRIRYRIGAICGQSRRRIAARWLKGAARVRNGYEPCHLISPRHAFGLPSDRRPQAGRARQLEALVRHLEHLHLGAGMNPTVCSATTRTARVPAFAGLYRHFRITRDAGSLK